jgi:hypothetical protein
MARNGAIFATITNSERETRLAGWGTRRLRGHHDRRSRLRFCRASVPALSMKASALALPGHAQREGAARITRHGQGLHGYR